MAFSLKILETEFEMRIFFISIFPAKLELSAREEVVLQGLHLPLQPFWHKLQVEKATTNLEVEKQRRDKQTTDRQTENKQINWRWKDKEWTRCNFYQN